MRSLKLFATALAVSLVVLGVSMPAQAQSFFEKIFGFGGDATSQQQSGVRAMPRTQTIPSSRFIRRDLDRANQSRASEQENDDDIGPPDSGGPYRTLCVRTCDGFYFPLRHNARHKNFASDAQSCKAGCGSDARLFYYPLNSGSVETMVDLKGKSYSELPHSFEYRKSLVQGCACKPVPWSEEAKAQHRKYAEMEAAEQAKDQKFVEARRNGEFAVAFLETTEAVGIQWAPAKELETDQALQTSLDMRSSGLRGVAIAEEPKSKRIEQSAVEMQNRAGVTEAQALPPQPVQRAVVRARYDRSRVFVVNRRAQVKPTSWSNSFFSGKSKFRYPGDPE